MSIERQLERIADSLEIITKGDTRRTEIAAAPALAPAVAPAALAIPVPPPAPAPAMPAMMPPLAAVPTQLPTGYAPAPAAAPAPAVAVPGAAPFLDHKGLMDYVMGKYRTLGPVKGALIQNVLSELGIHNMAEVKPDSYGVFFQKVEAIV